MKLRIACALVAFLSLMLSLTQLAVAQTAAPTASALPRLMRFGGTVKELSGSPLSGVVGITFAFYSEQSGGAPLWLETQNATVDGNGHYAVLLGSTKPDGLPAELFISEQARWVGVQVSGQAEQPRVLLVSAPYALKAGDAETIGGLPPSAFVLAAPQNGSASTYVAESSTAQSVSSGAAADVTTTGGTADYLPIFNGADTIIDSVLYQMGTGATAKVGINTTTPATTLDLNGAATVRGTLALPAVGAATATAGRISQPLTLAASAYNSSTPAAVNQTFQWQAEPTDNDTATPSATLDLLFGEGTTAPSLTGLRIASNGRISFATGQTFPGTGDGTLTGITTAIGSGLTGGGTSGTLKLGLLTSCASGQVLEWNGTVWACATASGSGTITGVTTSASSGLTGGGTSGTLNLQVNTALIPKLASANTFTTQQTITGSNTTQILNVTQSGAGLAIVAKGGVSGSSTAAAGSGVLGTGTGTEGYGVYGSETATIGNGYGVYGTNNTQAGAGVAGYAANTSYGIGVLGSSPSGIGVEGTTSGTASYGVYGITTATSGASSGVYGSGASPGGAGVYGIGATLGVYGTTSNVNGYAVRGVNTVITGTAVAGSGASLSIMGGDSVGTTSSGVWGDTGGNEDTDGCNCIGVQGTADNAYAGWFLNDSTDVPTLRLENTGTGGTGGAVFLAEGRSGSCVIGASGDLGCTGKVITAAAVDSGARKVALYSMQSPENWFEDAGSGQLSNGSARVVLDPTFAQTVNAGVEYHVFLTPNGDSRGLYVSQKTATGFEVHEQGGGTSNIAFDYRIMAKRAGYENIRLADLTEQFKKQEAQRQKMRRPGRPSAQLQTLGVPEVSPIRATAQSK